MILAKPPPRRRAPMAAQFSPSGLIGDAVIPGAITAEAYVEYVREGRINVNAAQFASNLAAALAAADVGAGRATVDGAIQTETQVTQTGSSALTVRVPLRVARNIPERDLSRAVVRALFWSTSVSYPRDGTLPREASDGGARIQSLVEQWPEGNRYHQILRDTRQSPADYLGPLRARFTVTRRAAPTAAAISLPPLGVRAASLSRDQVMRYQRALLALGFTNSGRTVADGAIGPNTRASTRAFQQAHQRTNAALAPRVREFLAAVDPLAIDGDLGPATQRALEWYLRPVANGGNGLSVADVPATQGGGGSVPVVRPPAPTPSTPGTTTPVVRPPAPVAPAPPVRPAPVQAGMSGTTIALAALGAAAVGVGIAYKDKLFGAPRGAAGRIARRARAGRGR